MTQIRIGIDAHVLGKNIGGVERYVEKVVEFLPDLRPHYQFVIFVTRPMAARFADDARANAQFIPLPVSDPILQRSFVLPWLVRRHRLDVLQVQRVAPWLFGGQCRILLTVHDLIPIKHPRAYPGFRDRLVRMLTPGSIARAEFVVCPTQSVCDEVQQTYPSTRAPVRPFYSGVDAEHFKRDARVPDTGLLTRYGIKAPFLFSPGSIESRRNVETIVEAIARIDSARRPMLVLSGSIRDAACFARVQALAVQRGVTESVRHIGFVAEDDLVGLYHEAAACIAASYDEGFNLLPLEAMACGTPVVCSDIPVHRELFDGAATFFSLSEPAELTAAIEDALCTGRIAGRNPAAAACVERLSWQATATRMAGFLDEIVRGAK